jgi:hypothetical protein
MRRVVGMTSSTIAELFVSTVTEQCLGIADCGKICDALVVTDQKIGVSAAHAGKHLAPMNFVDEYLEVETFAGFRVAQLRSVAKRTNPTSRRVPPCAFSGS